MTDNDLKGPVYVRVTPDINSFGNGKKYSHVRVEFVVEREPRESEQGEGKKFDSVPWYYDTVNGLLLKGLRVSAQADNETDRLYGFEASYSWHSVETSAEAYRIARTLARIEKGLQKINDDFGPTRSFVEYTLRLCKVLGVKGVACVTDEGRGYIAPVRDLYSILFNAAQVALDAAGHPNKGTVVV